jgi:integrase
VATAKAARTILSGVLGLAARLGAVEQNPVHDVGRIETPTNEARSLNLDEAKDLRARIAADKKARTRDLPDFTDMMLATGLRIGEWAAQMLRRRRLVATDPNGPVFTAPLGGLCDPSNTNADLLEAFDAAGYPWVTSHVYRKTVATLMDIAGLSARAAADQLGHAKVSMTQDNYFGRHLAKTGAAGVMESINDLRWPQSPAARMLCHHVDAWRPTAL